MKDKDIIDLSIVTFNSARWVDSFFNSLKTQNFPLDRINIYITDHGSVDGTVEFIIKKLNVLPFNKSKVLTQENVGFGAGHNNNFRLLSSDLVLVSNIDLTFENDAISHIVTYAKRDSDNTASWEFRQKPFEHPKVYNPLTLEVSWSSSACILFKKKALEKVKGYDERIFLYGEDVDISWRLRAEGYKLKYIPKAVCWHYTYDEKKNKDSQFLGSLLSNLYLRARFGTKKQISDGEKAYQSLIASLPKELEHLKNSLVDNYKKYKSNYNYFKAYVGGGKENPAFFKGWNYEKRRRGALYVNKKPLGSPLVSILLRTYNGRGKHLWNALTSISNQTYNNYEVIIVEDGTKTLKKVVDQFNNKKFRYYSLNQKGGRCRNGNLAMKKAKGEFFTFLDDDDFYFADHIEVLVNEVLFQKAKIVYSVAFEMLSDDARIPSFNKWSHKLFQPFNKFKLWQVNYIPILAVMFHRSCYEDEGGFDNSIPYLEDWDLWIRYSKSTSFHFVDKTTAVYRIPKEKTRARKRKSNYESHKKYIYEKQEKEIVNISIAEIRKYLNILEKDINELNREYLNILEKEINELNSEILAIKSSIFYKVGKYLFKPFKIIHGFIIRSLGIK